MKSQVVWQTSKNQLFEMNVSSEPGTFLKSAEIFKRGARKLRTDEGKSSFLCSRVLLPLYAALRSETIQSRFRKWILEIESPAHSLTIREIFRHFYSVEVGLFSGGPCRMKPNVFHAGTTIGRYVAISDSVRTFTRNHPFNLISTHGFFYNPALGITKGVPIKFNKLVIGNGVWIGHNALVLPPTEKIGDGAIITAGAVVSSNVPAYAVVAGHPARIVRFRFNQETIAKLVASRWWEKAPGDIPNDISLLLEADQPSAPGSADQLNRKPCC